MKTQRVRAGIIGCGSISGLHGEAWQKNPSAEVVACADTDEAKAGGFKRRFGVPDAVTDYRRLLDRKDVDAVDICIPTFLHAEAAVAAAQAGKHVLCEKPMAMKVGDAGRMIDAAESAGVRFMMAFPYRFSSQWNMRRRLIVDNEIGRPVSWRLVDATAGPTRPWFLDGEKGGGPFVDNFVHHYDFARFTFGEPRWAWASLRTMKPDSTALDTGVCVVEFEAGDQLMVSSSWGLPGGSHNECRGEGMRDVIGPRGVIAPGTPPSGPEERPHFLVSSEDEQVRKAEYERQPGGDTFRRAVAHFVECVLGGEQPRVTGHDGKRALEIALAILESSRTGAVVRL